MHLQQPHRLGQIPPVSLKLLVVLLLLIFSAQVYFANKTWRSYQVLLGARVIGVEQAADLRGYTELGDLIDTYGISVEQLQALLGVSQLPDLDSTLKTLAQDSDHDELKLISDIQRLLLLNRALNPQGSSAIGHSNAHPLYDATQALTDTGVEPRSMYDQVQAQLMHWLENYGIAVIVLVVFLGALGLPVPAGPMAAMTGILSFDGSLSATVSALSILVAAVIGDLCVYCLGRKADTGRLVMYGRWVGYTDRNRVRVLHLFERWGAITLLLTRSLVAHISAVASLLAGASGISSLQFTLYSLLGRSLWLFLYFGMGYLVGSDLYMASSFLSYLSLLLITILCATLLILLYRKQHTKIS